MKPLRRFSAAALLGFVATVCLVEAEFAHPADGRRADAPPNAFTKHNREDLVAPIRDKGEIRIIVGLQTPQEIARVVERTPDQVTEHAVSARQLQVLQRLAGHDVRNIKRFRWHHFIAMTVDARGLDALLSDPEVTSVAEDRPVYPTLLQTPTITRADAAWAAGFRGAGQAVAIIDTGVASGHPFFTGKVVEEACFSAPATGSTTTYCPNGESQQIGTGAGVNCPDSGCYHGTHVAGIAAGRYGVLASNTGGMAPDASVIAIQVFQRDCSSGTCRLVAWESDVIRALEHVYSLRGTYSIASANMSLGGGTSAANCDSDSPATASVIESLRADNIATVISSGNNANAGGISWPACISSAISVGSTNKQNGISSFSNSASFLSLLAPGEAILSSVPGGYGTLSGTSMAAPHVTGAWAVLKSAKPSATVAEVLAALQNTGIPLTDTRNGLTKPLIQIGDTSSQFGALGFLLGQTTPPSVTLTSPASGASFAAPASITLTATATATRAAISRVEFFNGTVKIGTAVAAPYSLVWTGVPQGAYMLTARAFDNVGGTAVSAPASISVSATTVPGPSLVVSPASVIAGGSLSASWSGIASPSSTDWIGLYRPGAANNAFIDWMYVSCSKTSGAARTSGSCTFGVPVGLAAGNYELRLLASNGFSTLMSSNTFTVPASTAAILSVSPTSVAAGGSITASWSGIASPTSTDWIGLYRPGTANTAFIDWMYVSCSKTAGIARAGGSCTFAVPAGLAPGNYELRLLANKGYTTLASSNAFTVPAPATAVLSVSPTSIAAGGALSVSWSGIASPSSTDWIGLYRPGAAATAFVEWMYVGCSKTAGAARASGSCTFVVPAGLAAGNYELRLLANNGYTPLAVSQSIAVQ